MVGVGSPTGLRAQGVVTAAFQPIFDLRDGAVVGYEALARPVDGTSPEELFATARAEGRLDAGRPRMPRGGAAGRRGGRARRAVRALPQRRRRRAGARPAGPADGRRDARDGDHRDRADRAPEAVLRTLTELRTRGWGVSLDDVGADSRSLAVMPLLYPDVIKLDLRLLAERDPIDVARDRHRGRRRGRAPARDRARRGHRLRRAAGDGARRGRDARSGLHARRAGAAARSAARRRAARCGSAARAATRPARCPSSA